MPVLRRRHKEATPSNRLSFFNEAAREAAARAVEWKQACDDGRHTYFDAGVGRGPLDDWSLSDVALSAYFEALPERSKAILALAALSDEELVERVAMALSARHGSEVIWAQDREAAPDVLAALGLPVAEREATG